MEATWCPRGCTPYPSGKCPDPESIAFRVGPGGSPPFDKAGTHLDGSGVDRGLPDGTIEVSAAWWKGLTRAQRCAVLAHEHAHADLGMRCEDCSDRHGGFLMRAWGFTLDGIRAAFDSLVHVGERLGAGARAVEGAQAHDKGAAGFDSTYQMTGAGFDVPAVATSGDVLRAAITAPPSVIPPFPATQRAVPPPNLGGVAPSPSTAGTSTIQPLPPFNPSTPGDPQAALDELFTGTKVDPVIVRSEVLAGLLVAFLVFVVFRWGGK